MHPRSRIATTMVVVAVALTAGGVGAADELRRFTRTEVHMATGFTLVAYAADATVADTADSSSKADDVLWATTRARVVLPLPGGP